jgi:hypothetical protein
MGLAKETFPAMKKRAIAAKVRLFMVRLHPFFAAQQHCSAA